MTKRIIPQQEATRSKRLNSYLQGLRSLYQEDLEKMITFCYEEFDATYEQVGKALGKSKQMISQQYPKNKKEKHE